MEENGTPDKSYMEWCFDQSKSFVDLVNECESRVVMFNNWTKDKILKYLENFRVRLRKVNDSFMS